MFDVVKLFISWSGSQSKAVGAVLHKYLPRILQSIRPWMSETDIESGQRWQQEIGSQLESCDVGLCIVTRTNFKQPWLNFEAGALSKSMDRGRPIGLFFDVRDSEISGPILQFQCRQGTKDGVLTLVRDLNGLLLESALDEAHLVDTFDRYWPSIEECFNEIRKQESPDGAPVPQREDREILEEVLHLVRALHQPPPVLPGGAAAVGQLSPERTLTVGTIFDGASNEPQDGDDQPACSHDDVPKSDSR